MLKPCLFSAYFSTFKQIKIQCLENGAVHSGLGLPTSINLIKQSPTDKPIDQSNVGSFSLTLSSSLILDYVRLMSQSAFCHYDKTWPKATWTEKGLFPYTCG